MSDTLDPLKTLADAIEMPVWHLKEAVEGIRQERLKEALLAKVQIIRERNTAILPSGEIVSRETPGAMAYESPSPEPSSDPVQLEQPSIPRELEDVKKKWQSDKKWLHAAIHACFKHGVPLGSSELCEAVKQFKEAYIPREDVLPLVRALHRVVVDESYPESDRLRQAEEALQTFTAKHGKGEL